MKNISVIIPAYNEEKRLGKTLIKWQCFLNNLNPDYKIYEILVVDDGSNDKTIAVAQLFNKILPIKIIKINQNTGKGNAVRNGVLKSNGDLIFIYDADAAVEPSEINKMLEYYDETDIIIGSRVAKGSKTKISAFRRFVGLCFHLYCLPLLGNIKDASCGAKIFKKAPAKKIFSIQKINRFAFDIEILWLSKKLNYKIKEVGIEWQEIPGSKVNVLKDSLEMFISVLHIYKKQFLN
jgi:dolichyl-phosphate beta-glucosyltransferase